MNKADWNTTDRVLYGIMAGGVVLWAISQFIEACRSRPKIQMMVLGVKGPFVEQPVAQPGPDESSADSSAAE